MDIGLLLSIVSLVISVAGILLTYISFFSPTTTLRFAVRYKDQWIFHAENHGVIYIYGHKYLSGLTLVIDFDDVCVENFFEEWMDDLFYADRRSSSYHVMCKFNGTTILKELFLSYDGNRNFIPVPKRTKRGERTYLFFDDFQRQLMAIVGKQYLGTDFTEIENSIVNGPHNPILKWRLKEYSASDIANLGRRIDEFKKKSIVLNNQSCP